MIWFLVTLLLAGSAVETEEKVEDIPTLETSVQRRLQFFGGGGGFGAFGNGCGQSPPSIGNQCYMGSQDGKTFCTAEGSSTYQHAPYYGDYKAYLAVDGQLSPGNSGFFHSNLESYPWLKIKFVESDLVTAKRINVKRVEIYQRCDANELYHQTSFQIRGGVDAVTIGRDGDDVKMEVIPTPRLIGGKICKTVSQQQFTGGTKFTVPCNEELIDVTEIWIQKTTLNSQGSGWPNYNGNRWNSYTGNSSAQNTNSPVCFLMINEVVVY